MLPFCGSQLVLEKRLRDWEERRGSRQEAKGAWRREKGAEGKAYGCLRAVLTDSRSARPVEYGSHNHLPFRNLLRAQSHICCLSAHYSTGQAQGEKHACV